MKGFIWCNRPSNSAKALSLSTGFRRIRRANSRFRGGLDRVVVNWGSSTSPNALRNAYVFNEAAMVRVASNKLNCLKVLKEELAGFWDYIPVIPFTEDIHIARSWIDSGQMVVCRTILNGHSGEGIVLAKSLEEIVPAPLYTMYVPKDAEWRVHVFKHEDGVDFHIQKKVKRKNFEGEHNRQIRNHQNGYIYQINNLNNIPADMCGIASDAVNGLGLDFGAVDVIQRSDKIYILEVNTAPGLEGTTLEVYTRNIKKMIEDI